MQAKVLGDLTYQCSILNCGVKEMPKSGRSASVLQRQIDQTGILWTS